MPTNEFYDEDETEVVVSKATPLPVANFAGEASVGNTSTTAKGSAADIDCTGGFGSYIVES